MKQSLVLKKAKNIRLFLAIKLLELATLRLTYLFGDASPLPVVVKKYEVVWNTKKFGIFSLSHPICMQLTADDDAKA